MQTLKSELLLAATLLCVGLLVLPVAIFSVGQVAVGPYEGDGVEGLISALWTRLGEGSPAAWALVLSPYVAIQLLRLAFRLLRRPPVTPTRRPVTAEDASY